MPRREGRDFFISYRSADQAWAEWIAWELEAAGYTVFVQAWDFRPGQNFVHQMQQGASSCRRTTAVLTPAYVESGFTRAEWYSAFARDPMGEKGLLLPVRVQECDIDGLLGQIIYIDLVGLEKVQARERLLAGIEGTRAKPAQPPDFPRSAEDRRGLLILLNSVEQFWVKGVLEQSVQHEALINLGKETKADTVEHPWEQVLELPGAAGKLLPADTKIADVFESVGRLLLILGEPGSGKTITLLELGARSGGAREKRPGAAVPFVFNLSSWTERLTSLADWLTEELNSRYRISKRLGRSWIEANRLVLLLDGLDEVQAGRRAACIRAINAFLKDQGTTGLVVCSRLTEYAGEPVRLRVSGAICLRPLTQRQVEDYLAQFGSELGALRTALEKDQALRDLAQSPLMLSVMTLAYQGASINALAGDAIETPGARRRQVFNTYIDRMFARKGKAAGSAHAKARTKSSLSWLANNMQRHGQSIFLIEQMQPTWLNNVRQIFIYLLSSRLATVAAIWAAVSLSGVVIILTDGAAEFASSIKSMLSSSSWAMLYGAQILTFLLGAFYSCSIDLSRYHIETPLSTPRISPKVINNQFPVILANMLGWAAIATVIHTLFIFESEHHEIVPYVFGTQWGLIFGMISCRRSVSRDIRIHDRLMWSWTGPIMISIPAFIVIAPIYVAILLASHVRIVNDTAATVTASLAAIWSSMSLFSYTCCGRRCFSR